MSNHIADAETNISLCGQTLDGSFHFKTIDQAFVNAKHGTLKRCIGCMTIVTDVFQNSLLRAIDETVNNDIIQKE